MTHDPNRDAVRSELRQKGFSEENIATFEEGQAKALAAGDRFAAAAELADPLMLASLAKPAFFTGLPDEMRALVTLWIFDVHLRRNGPTSFVEDEPSFIIDDVPRAARLLGLEPIAVAFERLVPLLSRGTRGRYSVKTVDWRDHEGLDRTVLKASSERALEDVLVELALARRAEIEPLHETARAVVAKRDEKRKSAAESKLATQRAKWDAVREKAKPWSASARFAAGDILVHAKLGVGRVLRAEPQKIEVELEDGTVRVLVHAR